MTLFVGFLTSDSVCMAVDARGAQNIPVIGMQYYDCGDKLASFGEKDSLWMTGAGLTSAMIAIYEELDARGIDSIDMLEQVDSSLFKEKHEEMLIKYQLEPERNKDNSIHYLNLLFGGIDGNKRPKLCFVDSKSNYEKQWLTNPGDCVLNRMLGQNANEILSERLKAITKRIGENEDLDFVIQEVKMFFNQVAQHDKGISPLKDFVRITLGMNEHKEFMKLRKKINDVKFMLHNLIFFKLLRL